MSRSGYSDDFDEWEMNLWRGQVASAIRGVRGQALLRDLRNALDAMPEKALITGELVTSEGDCCALGCLAISRNLDVSAIDPGDGDQVGMTFGIAPQLAREIAYENDERGWDETPEQRWSRMQRWVERHIKAEPATS